MPDALERARALLGEARRILVLTGAGVSTDSGIPDFRGPDGLWTRDPAAEKAATLANYVADAALRRRVWHQRATSTAPAPQPNAAHRALVDLEATGRLDTLVTQNIDGLHQAAGSDPTRVVEIHGTLREVACLSCGDRTPMAEVVDRVAAGDEDPHCDRCSGLLKAATISFGQDLVAADLDRAAGAARRCDALLAAGTTLAVYPIAAVVPEAARRGAPVIIANGEPTAMDDLAEIVVRGPLGTTLPAMVEGIPALA